MDIIAHLNSTPGLRIKCPNCDNDFPVKRARLFDVGRVLPPAAIQIIEQRRMEIADAQMDLQSRRKAAKERPAIGARVVRIGKVVEKIASTLPGFPVRSADCRSLFEPIDYVVFHGLSTKGKIESVEFVDVKSGNASLTHGQKLIRSAVKAGRVSLLVADAL